MDLLKNQYSHFKPLARNQTVRHDDDFKRGHEMGYTLRPWTRALPWRRPFTHDMLPQSG